MNLRLQTLATLLSFFLYCAPLVGQQRSFTDFNATVLTTSGVIQGEQVDGYYFLNRSREGWGRNAVYTYSLEITDHNLDPVGTKVFTSEEEIQITDVVYNGTYLAVRLVNIEEEKVWVEVIDAQGNTINTVDLRYDKIYDIPSNSAATQKDTGPRLIPTSNGFISFRNYTTKNRLLSPRAYELQMIANDTEDPGWTQQSQDIEGLSITSAYLGYHKGILMTIESAFPFWGNAGTKSFVAYDAASGDEVFRTNADDIYQYGQADKAVFLNDYILVAIRIKDETETSRVPVPTIGLQLVALDYDGNLAKQSSLSYKTELASQLGLEVERRGKIEELGILFLNDFVINQNEEIILALEGFTKKPRLSVNDAILVHVDSELQLQSIDRMAKPATARKPAFSTTEISEYSLVSTATSQGLVDFQFQDILPNGVITAFLNYEATSRREGRWTIYTSFFDGESFTTQSLPLDPECTHARIYPARAGYIMVMEYYEEELRLETRLERWGM